MQTIDEITAEIIKHEGGFVNDPSDPGGATKYGVTIGTLKNLRGKATIADVQALTLEDAYDIYQRHYFYGRKIDQLPARMQASVFDMQVNAGANAIKILQRLLAEFQDKVTVDGGLGPQSIGATNRVFKSAGVYLVNAYGIARRNYYFAVGDKREESRKYCRTEAGGKGGWITRAEYYIHNRYHLSERAFKQRISKWAS